MKLLKPKEVMERLSVSRSKVYRMIKNKDIPSIIIGGCVRVPEEILERLIRQQLDEHLDSCRDGMDASENRLQVILGGKDEMTKQE